MVRSSNFVEMFAVQKEALGDGERKGKKFRHCAPFNVKKEGGAEK